MDTEGVKRRKFTQELRIIKVLTLKKDKQTYTPQSYFSFKE